MESSQPPPKKLLDQVRDAIRVKHYSYRTEETRKLPTVLTSKDRPLGAIAPALHRAIAEALRRLHALGHRLLLDHHALPMKFISSMCFMMERCKSLRSPNLTTGIYIYATVRH
ncbi:MAG: hypothetical protein KME06_18930 [Kastovskya adunca ATA6-11-RM4]|nr:hypothetical protein [Kastovskya adunca ATA6-11-RM4]